VHPTEFFKTDGLLNPRDEKNPPFKVIYYLSDSSVLDFSLLIGKTGSEWIIKSYSIFKTTVCRALQNLSNIWGDIEIWRLRRMSILRKPLFIRDMIE